MSRRDILPPLPSLQGHFLLESGYHTDQWLDLDALFVDPNEIAPLTAALAEKLRGHSISAVCGPLFGGAFLAQAVAGTLGGRFYYTQRVDAMAKPGLFKAEYRLPPELKRRVRGERVAVVDDVISAGSSVRATIAALDEADASTIVVGTFLVLGATGAQHLANVGLPLETLDRREFAFWSPHDCPLCRVGTALEEPH